MAIRLQEPVEIIADNGMSGIAHEAQFGTTAQAYNDPPLVIYEVLGNTRTVNGVEKFVPLNGMRPDGKEAANTVAATRHEYNHWVAQPDVQSALAKLKQLYEYIDSGREDAEVVVRPSWLPVE